MVLTHPCTRRPLADKTESKHPGHARKDADHRITVPERSPRIADHRCCLSIVTVPPCDRSGAAENSPLNWSSAGGFFQQSVPGAAVRENSLGIVWMCVGGKWVYAMEKKKKETKRNTLSQTKQRHDVHCSFQRLGKLGCQSPVGSILARSTAHGRSGIAPSSSLLAHFGTAAVILLSCHCPLRPSAPARPGAPTSGPLFKPTPQPALTSSEPIGGGHAVRVMCAC